MSNLLHVLELSAIFFLNSFKNCWYVWHLLNSLYYCKDVLLVKICHMHMCGLACNKNWWENRSVVYEALSWTNEDWFKSFAVHSERVKVPTLKLAWALVLHYVSYNFPPPLQIYLMNLHWSCKCRNVIGTKLLRTNFSVSTNTYMTDIGMYTCKMLIISMSLQYTHNSCLR